MIDGPTAYSMLAEAPLAARRMHVRAISDGALNSLLGEVGRWNVFITGARGDLTIDPSGNSAGIDGTNKGYTVGIGMRATESFAIGAAVGHSQFDGSFGRSLGGYRSGETTLSLYASLRSGGLWGSGVVSVSNIDFGRLQRNVVLGAAVRTANASTSGSNSSAFVNLGFDFPIGRTFFVGPFVGAASQNVDVNAFDEADAGSVNLRISAQKRRSEVWRAGLRAYALAGNWTPFLSVTADRERHDDARFVTASPISLASGNSYDVMAFSPDKNSTTFLAGIHGRLFEQLGLSVSYYNVSGRSGIKEDGVTGVLSYRF